MSFLTTNATPELDLIVASPQFQYYLLLSNFIHNDHMICILFFPYFSISDFFKPLFTQRISSSGGVKTLLCRLVYFAFPFSVAKAALQPPMSVHLSPKPPKIISLYHYLHHYPNHHMQHHTHTIIHTTMLLERLLSFFSLLLYQ